ncbi:hypothetical protein GCM10023149_18240 [Mucilaginibacter gynuensis]|uniref:Lipoprotein n=1 Tax=Mucilaginibacter gynuensis TaxID=1302236 RepID=A0ABP8G8S4_9SPHI
MKKLHVFIMVICLLAITTSCHRGNVTSITSNADGYKTKIEYSGRIVFNEEKTAIADMSPNSYLKYDEDGKELTAESDSKSRIIYVIDGKVKNGKLDEADQEFLSHAIKIITKQQAKLKAGK